MQTSAAPVLHAVLLPTLSCVSTSIAAVRVVCLGLWPSINLVLLPVFVVLPVCVCHACTPHTHIVKPRVVCCVMVTFPGTQLGVSASARQVEHTGSSNAGILIPPAVLPALPGRLLQSHAHLSVAHLPPLHVHEVSTSRRGCSQQWWLYGLRDPCVARV